MGWIGVKVTRVSDGVSPLTSDHNRYDSTGKCCVLRAPSIKCQDLFNSPQLPDSIRENEKQIKSANPCVLCGLYVPPPLLIAKSQLPMALPDAIDEILPLHPKHGGPPPAYVNYRFDAEEWTNEVFTLFRDSQPYNAE